MAGRRGSNGERGWGGPGCQEWGCRYGYVIIVCVCVWVCVCVFRCLLHLRVLLVLFFCSVLFHFSVSFLSLCLSGCHLCWREGSSAIRWEREVHSEYPFIVFSPSLSVYRSISASFLGLTFIYMRSYGCVSVNTHVFSPGVSNSGLVVGWCIPSHESHIPSHVKHILQVIKSPVFTLAWF